MDHTADLAIRVYGNHRGEIFENAAYALFDNLVDLKGVRPIIRQEIEVSAEDLPELLVSWLNHLLFLWETRGLLFKDFKVRSVDPETLKASAWGEVFQAGDHEILTEIKAATYHNLHIEEDRGLWQAEIILDL
jgi:SHS2 domain-containing protein